MPSGAPVPHTHLHTELSALAVPLSLSICLFHSLSPPQALDTQTVKDFPHSRHPPGLDRQTSQEPLDDAPYCSGHLPNVLLFGDVNSGLTLIKPEISPLVLYTNLWCSPWPWGPRLIETQSKNVLASHWCAEMLSGFKCSRSASYWSRGGFETQSKQFLGFTSMSRDVIRVWMKPQRLWLK